MDVLKKRINIMSVCRRAVKIFRLSDVVNFTWCLPRNLINETNSSTSNLKQLNLSIS